MHPPHIKSSYGIQNNILNPMRIGLGIDYVTWRNIPQRIPSHQIFIWDTNEISNPMCMWLGTDYFTCRNIRNFSSCRTENIISNAFGIALGIDFVTWRNIQNWIAATQNLHVHLHLHMGYKTQFQSYGCRGSNWLCPIEEYPIMDPPHIKCSRGTQNTISNPMCIGLGMYYVTRTNIQTWIPSHQIFVWDTGKKFQMLWV